MTIKEFQKKWKQIKKLEEKIKILKNILIDLKLKK